MPTNDYVFITHWLVPGPIEPVYDRLIDIDGYQRWRPEVYLRVEPLSTERARLGAKSKLLTKGKLPYQIRWAAEVIEAKRPNRFTIRATGDFEERGIWWLEPAGNETAVTFDWRFAGGETTLTAALVHF